MPKSRNARKRIKVGGHSYTAKMLDFFQTIFKFTNFGPIKVRKKLDQPRPKGFFRMHVDTLKSKSLPGPITPFTMKTAVLEDHEMEGVIESHDIVVHGSNRATLIRKAHRILHEQHGIRRPDITTIGPKIAY